MDGDTPAQRLRRGKLRWAQDRSGNCPIGACLCCSALKLPLRTEENPKIEALLAHAAQCGACAERLRLLTRTRQRKRPPSWQVGFGVA